MRRIPLYVLGALLATVVGVSGALAQTAGYGTTGTYPYAAGAGVSAGASATGTYPSYGYAANPGYPDLSAYGTYSPYAQYSSGQYNP